MPLERCLQRLAQGHYQLAMDVPTMRVDPLRFTPARLRPGGHGVSMRVSARPRLGVNRAGRLAGSRSCVLRGFPLEEDMGGCQQVDQSTSLEQLFSKGAARALRPQPSSDEMWSSPGRQGRRRWRWVRRCG